MAQLYERKEMKNLTRVFRDRFDAGEVLGRMLAPFYAQKSDLTVLAIPMGGVPVALRIHKALTCPLDLVIVRKIQIPGNTEAGFGAMTSEGDVFLNESLLRDLRLRPDQIEQQTRKVKADLEQRNRSLRAGRPFPDLKDRTVILVDDGLASGYTMKASIHMCAKRNAGKIVVAVPTAPRRTLDAIQDSVSEIYCANIRDVFSFAVAEAYQAWHDLSDEQTLALLEESGLRP